MVAAILADSPVQLQVVLLDGERVQRAEPMTVAK